MKLTTTTPQKALKAFKNQTPARFEIWNYFSQIPIKESSLKAQKPSVNLVDQIITQKQQNQDTTSLEKEIDKLVYHLYELTDEEIMIVEGEK